MLSYVGKKLKTSFFLYKLQGLDWIIKKKIVAVDSAYKYYLLLNRRQHQKLRCVCFRGRPCNQTCQNSEAVIFFLFVLTHTTRVSELFLSLTLLLPLINSPHSTAQKRWCPNLPTLLPNLESVSLSLSSIQQ